MNIKYFIAKRYLFSKKESKFISFITYISVAGIALGVAVLIVTVSILAGFEIEIQDKVAGLVSHMQISSFKSEGVRNYNDVIKNIKATIPEITSVSAFVQRECVLRYKDNIEGVLLKGISGVDELTGARSHILHGEANVQKIDSTYSRIIIGDKIASKYNIQVGDRIIIFGLKGIPSPANQPKIKQFKVSGIYESGLKDYDDLIVYTDLETTQKLFDMPETVSGIEMNVNDVKNVEVISEKVRNVIRYPLNVKTLHELYRELFTWVELQKAPTPIILGLIIIVATFNIIGSLLMMILEKTQSIGILKSLGFGNFSIMKIFFYDGLIIGVIGILIGNIVGVGLSLLELNFKFFKLPDVYYMKNVPILLDPLNIIFISLITFILIMLATLIPSFIASRFEPVKSLRFV